MEVPITNDKVPPNPKLSGENNFHPANDIGEEFPIEPPRKHIHVFVERPSGKWDSDFIFNYANCTVYTVLKVLPQPQSKATFDKVFTNGEFAI